MTMENVVPRYQPSFITRFYDIPLATSDISWFSHGFLSLHGMFLPRKKNGRLASTRWPALSIGSMKRFSWRVDKGEKTWKKILEKDEIHMCILYYTSYIYTQ
jgi:hypothetical protein